MAVRYSFALLALPGIFAAISAQTFPICALGCLATAPEGGCSATDNACLCRNQQYVQSTTSCIQSLCSGSDLTNAEAVALARCAAVGVTIVISSTPTGTSSSTTSQASNTHMASTSTPTPTLTSVSTHSHISIGAPIGDAIGGCVVVSILAFAAFYVWRQKRRQSLPDIDSESKNQVSNGDPMPTEGRVLPYVHSFREDTDVPATDTSNNQTHQTTQPLTASVSSLPPASTPHASDTGTPAAEIIPFTQRPTSRDAAEHVLTPLTPEDTQFFANLYNLNVPAAEIASMMEAVRTGRQATSGTESSISGVVRREGALDSEAPPEYDFKAN